MGNTAASPSTSPMEDLSTSPIEEPVKAAYMKHTAGATIDEGVITIPPLNNLNLKKDDCVSFVIDETRIQGGAAVGGHRTTTGIISEFILSSNNVDVKQILVTPYKGVTINSGTTVVIGLVHSTWGAQGDGIWETIKKIPCSPFTGGRRRNTKKARRRRPSRKNLRARISSQ